MDHLGSVMIWKIIENAYGHLLKKQKILQFKEFLYVVCSQGKLITKLSLAKVEIESLAFLEPIQGDMHKSIHPSCGIFKYYMISVDIFTRWSYVCKRPNILKRLLAKTNYRKHNFQTILLR